MKKPTIIVKDKGELPKAPGIIHAQPALIWPSIPDTYKKSECDRKTAPTYDFVTRRRGFLLKLEDNEHGLGCKALWGAVKSSAQILVVDTHFSKRGMISLRDHIIAGRSTVEDLRVITAQKDGIDVFRDIKQILYKDRRLSSESKIGIAIIKRNTPPFIHDRFAVTDGELWHFGGTVSGEQKLTAVSRGWNADSHGFIFLFKQIWGIAKTHGDVR